MTRVRIQHWTRDLATVTVKPSVLARLCGARTVEQMIVRSPGGWTDDSNGRLIVDARILAAIEGHQ